MRAQPLRLRPTPSSSSLQAQHRPLPHQRARPQARQLQQHNRHYNSRALNGALLRLYLNKKQPRSVPMGVSSVKYSDIAAAAVIDNLDIAALHIQKIASITEGDVAGISLNGDEWRAAGKSARVQMIRSWLKNEAAYEKD